MNLFFGQNQRLQIRGTDYTVLGVIEFEEDGWQWQEYRLVDMDGTERWLNVEVDDGAVYCSLYEMVSANQKNYYKNLMRRMKESGTAIVNRYGGDVDVELDDFVRYQEFQDDNGKRFFSVEKWEDETEYSIGEKLQFSEVLVYEQNAMLSFTPDVQRKNSENTVNIGSGKGCLTVFKGIGIFIVICIVVNIISGFFNRDQLSSYIEKNYNFTYVTSITNNENSKRAKVYSTTLTVEDTVQNIISGLEGEIKKISDEDEELQEDSIINDGQVSSEGIGLTTRYEYAYVYTSETGETYIQVSSNKFMTDDQTDAYRSRNHNHHYRRMYRTKKKNRILTDIARSARQESARSRRSSGGGTSHGK